MRIRLVRASICAASCSAQGRMRTQFGQQCPGLVVTSVQRVNVGEALAGHQGLEVIRSEDAIHPRQQFSQNRTGFGPLF